MLSNAKSFDLELLRNLCDETDYTKDGKCSGCGNCCSNILPMSKKEVDGIKRYVKQHGIKNQKHLMPTAELAIDLTCPFLNLANKDKKCVIYPVRPLICKTYQCNRLDSFDARLLKDHRVPIDVRAMFFGDEVDEN